MKAIKLIVLMLAVVGISCNSDQGNRRIIVRLTDSPGDYEQVNIDLAAVEVHVDGNNEDGGWISLDANTGIYNLLDLTDGVETVIANSEIPAGYISQLRLILGDNNSVMIDGELYDLKTPSGQQSGLKFQIHESLTEGITYSVLLDFDAARSVVKTGNGTYNLKPVIKTITEARDGAISGTVEPAELNVAVYAIQGEDTLATSYATENSAEYFLGGLEAGTYTVSFDPGDLSEYQGAVIESVEVNLGEITTSGNTILELKE